MSKNPLSKEEGFLFNHICKAALEGNLLMMKAKNKETGEIQTVLGFIADKRGDVAQTYILGQVHTDDTMRWEALPTQADGRSDIIQGPRKDMLALMSEDAPLKQAWKDLSIN